MPVQEEVLIVLKAKDEVSKTVENIRKTIESLGKTFNNSIPNASQFTEPLSAGVDGLDSSVEKVSYRMTGFGDITNSVGSQANINFTQMAERMDKFHVGLNRVTNAMTGLFGTMGLWGMAHESWMFATQRQTNQIYLGMRRGTEEAKNMYNEIMNIVMELPGDDTFLTTILTQASGRDMTMSIENVKQLGDAVADYYVGATAKGQLSFETQRELTSYILTGETRMFTNSILADEIDLLKNKNTVSERSLALQEALNRTGFGGMAHYESAVNEMEEFKGHFQKAFADLGSVALPVVQLILKIYNAFDTLLGNGGISAGLIVLATSIAGLTTALGTIGFVTPMVNEGVRSVVLFGQGISNMRSKMADVGAIGFFREHIRGLVNETKTLTTPIGNIQKLADSTKQLNVLAGSPTGELTPTLQYELENGAIITNTQLKLQNLMATTRLEERELALMITQEGVTYEEYLNNVGLEANTMAKLQNMAKTMEMTDAELLNLAVTSDMTTAEFLETLEINFNSIQKDTNTVSTLLNADAELEDAISTNVSTWAKIRGGATNLYVAFTSFVRGDAEGYANAVENSALLTKLASWYASLRNSLSNLWEAFTLWTVTDGEIALGTAKSWGIATKIADIGTTISSALTKLWEAITNIFSSETEGLGILTRLGSIGAKILDIGATIGLNIATWGLIGAGVMLDIILSPIVLTILAIVGAVLLLIWGFEQLGKAFGWWDDIGGMFDAIQSGLQRIWDAFVNSEPVQQIITTFQKLWYTLETLFNFLGSIGGGLWELIFGVGQNEDGTLDIVGILLEIGGAIGNFLYWISPIEEILSIFDAIGSAIAWVLDTWNEFVDTPEMQQVIKGFQEVRVALGEVWDELFTAFDEIGTALGEIWEALFGGDETEQVEEGGNLLLEVFKAIAWMLNNITIPILKNLVTVLKLIITPIKWLADGLKWVASGFQDTNTKIEDTTEKGDILGSIFNSISDSLQRLWDVLQPIIEIITQIMGWVVSSIIEDITKSITGLVNIFNALLNVGRFIISIFQQMWSAIGGLDGIVNGLSWAFGGLLGFLKDVGMFINEIVDKAKWLMDTFGWVGDAVSGAINGATDVLTSNGNLAQTQNTNYGAESSNNLLGMLGLDPNQLVDTGNQINNALNDSNQAYLNRNIRNVKSNDPVTNYLLDAPLDAEAYGYLTQPVDYSKTPNMTEPYKTVNSNQQHIVQNIFNEGSVQADARNMTKKDIQTLFTGAFGYNKARGTEGIIR